jgi:hypothetical protein
MDLKKYPNLKESLRWNTPDLHTQSQLLSQLTLSLALLNPSLFIHFFMPEPLFI